MEAHGELELIVRGLGGLGDAERLAQFDEPRLKRTALGGIGKK